MKFVDTAVVFSEIPDEVTLAINISECPIKCPDCHSKYLWENIGKTLDGSSLNSLIKKNEGISCVCLMGGDADVPYVMSLFSYIKKSYPELKTAWYSGQNLSYNSLLRLVIIHYPDLISWAELSFKFHKASS